MVFAMIEASKKDSIQTPSSLQISFIIIAKILVVLTINAAILRFIQHILYLYNYNTTFIVFLQHHMMYYSMIDTNPI